MKIKIFKKEFHIGFGTSKDTICYLPAVYKQRTGNSRFPYAIHLHFIKNTISLVRVNRKIPYWGDITITCQGKKFKSIETLIFNND